MSKDENITPDEAVALMMNMDYIPEGFTLEEMLDAFEEEAKFDNYTILPFEGAESKERQCVLSKSYKSRMEACTARIGLAKLIKNSLLNEIESARLGNTSLISLSTSNNDSYKITQGSLENWANDQYGITIPKLNIEESSSVKTTWENITISLRVNNKIKYSIENGSSKTIKLVDIELINRKDNTPNNQCGILIGLAQGKKFPSSVILQGKDKAAISKLRSALKKITKINSDPFLKYSPDKGWKPKFKINDNRNAADVRAKEKAIISIYDDTRDYDAEDDPAGLYLEENDRDSYQ